MRRRFAPSIAVLFLAIISLVAPGAHAQCVSLTTLGSAYTQNFDTLSNTAGSTTNNLTIPGWFLTESGGGARDNEQYAVDTGASTTGDMYSYGAAASTERALGQLRSGTLIPIWGACFTNNTGSTINNLAVTYNGEEWRLGTAARTDQINFEYSTNATDLVTGTYTGVTALNFVTPDTVTTGAKNGNAAADRTAVSSTISSLSIANGATFWIRWTDTDATGADDGLAVDDFTLTPTTNVTPPVVNSIVRASTNPTNAASVNYTVTFSQSVTGVDTTDFTLTTTGVSGASVSNVTGSGTTYTVTVNTGTGSGTIRLDVTDNDSIVNGATPLGGSGAGNGNFTSGEVYTIDKTAPAVQSIVRASSNPTNASTVNFTVTFSELVSGVDATDFTLATSGVTGATVSGVTGSGPYTVSVNTGSGDGTIELDFTSNGSVIDAVGNPTVSGFSGEVYTIDKTGPSVLSSTRADTDPTSANSVNFTVTFNESVTGVDISDFSLTTTGIAGASVTNVTGSGATYTVTASTGTGATGTLRLDVNNGASINDAAGNALASGFTGGEMYTIDRNAPAVQSVTRNDANPNRNASVNYTVTFTQSVTGVDTMDFTLTTTGVTGASVSGVTGSGSSYTVTVNTGSGDGTIRLDVVNNGSIQSGTAVPLTAGFTGGEVYTIDKTAPTVISSNPGGNSSTNAATSTFTVTFSENVSGVSASDFALTTTGVTGASVTGVSGSGNSYSVSVNTGSGEGTIRCDVVTGGTIIDAAGNLFATGFTGGTLLTIDRTPPTVVSVTRADANPSSASTVDFTVTFSEVVSGPSNTDFVVAANGVTGASVTAVNGSGSARTITVNTGTGDGTLRLDVVTGGTIIDAAGNLFATGFNSGEVYTIDKVAPSVVSINRAGPSPTGAPSISWTVTFSETVTGVDAGDFSLVAGGGVSGASISGVTGSGTTYTVTANSGSGDGTLGLNLVDDDSIVDVTSKPLGGAGAGNGNFTGQVYNIDHTVPTVVSINRAAASPTSAATVTFTVTFSESVTGVGSSDFAVASSGLSGSAITNVTGSGTTYTVTVSSGTGNGTLGLNLVDDDSIIDVAANPLGGPGAGSGNFTGQVYTVNRTAAAHLVLSQIYGGGGNAGATYKNDFIELFNPTAATVNLSGWSVQYSSAAGSAWQVTNLTGSIAPGHYFLVQEAAGAGGSVNLPTPDTTGGINMSGTAGKIALSNSTTALTGTCPTGGITVIDFIGYGTTANCFEGATTANLSNTTSATRIDNGCTDTDHNNTDFTIGAVNPRNTASAPWSCGGLIGAGSASPSTVGASANTLLTVSVTPAQSPTSTGITATGDLSPIGGSATQTFYDDGSHGDVTPGDNVFSFNATVGAATTSGGKTINVSLADGQGRVGASTISLTVLGATNPSGSGSANPASVAPNQSSLLVVLATPGQNPPSTGITVTADLTAIGGSATQTMFDDGTNGDVTIGDGTFSYNATVANGTSLGTKSLPITIADAQSRVGMFNLTLTVQSSSAPPAPTGLIATPGNVQVSLAWNTSAGATGYNVMRGTSAGGPYSNIAPNVATNGYLDTAVANGTRYYYVVTALNMSAESGPSNEANAMPAAPPPMGSLAKVYFIDIGQGASTLIVSPTGKTLLVDGGPTGQGTAKVVPLLSTLGISRLDYSVLTHYHIDHDDGLTETINAGKGALSGAYDNGDTTPLAPPNAGSTKTAYQNYVNALTSHSIPRVRPEDQMTGTLAGTDIDLGGGMHATIMAQGGKLLSGGSITIDNSDLNTESISVLVQYNNFDFLVSGDLTGGGSTSTAKTPDVETYVAQLTGDVDVVEYDHHGSTTANNPRFLRLLKAEAAVAECGFTNTFGHPNRETVNKYLNIAATTGNTYGGTALPNPGNGPVSYQTDPSPATDDRVSRQGYSGAAPANAGNGTILLKTDGTSSFTMESFDDGGVRISPASHAYSLDSTGAGVETNFPPTVIPSISPVVPLSSDTVTVSAMVNDREDAITSVTLNYSLNGAAQAPQTMTLNAGFYQANIPAQPDATRVDISITAVAGGKSTTTTTGYFSGTTPISTLRVLDALGEPLYLDYAARVSGTATSDTNVFSVGTNDDYVQDGTGGINVWRTIQPSVPPVDPIATGHTYTVAGRIGELAGRFHIEVTPPFASVAPTPYTITQTGNGTITPASKTIAQLLTNTESFEAQLVSISNCTITQGTIPGSGAANDAFLTISDGTGSFQLKVDKDTDVPGFATPMGAFTVTGIIQQDDFLRPFDSGYDITPRSRVDLGGAATSGPGLITIAAARIDVDASGNTPGDYVPDLINSTVHVQGVVTSINFRASNGSGIEYYIQDPTAGVDVFSTATTRAFNINDEVDVIATVKQFNGLTEIDPGATTSNLTLLAAGTLPAVSPTLVTVPDIGDNGAGEPQEGKLLRINNVTLTAPPATWAASTNYTFTDGMNTGTLRISASSNLVGQAPPAGTFSIIGVLGQFDSAAPFDSGYQLFPRSTSDILPAVATPASISATAGTPQTATINSAYATQFQATVLDSGNAPVNGTGVTFTAPASGASGTFPGGVTSVNVITNASGIATAPVFTANATTGSYSVTATAGAVQTTFSLTNLSQPATHFALNAPASVTSGNAFTVTVTAQNGSNATATGYTGTVHFSSTSNGTLPADYTFIAGDNGTHTFTSGVTLTSLGAQTIDVGDGSISGSANVTVNPQPATHFTVSAPVSVTSGVAFSVVVTALDANNAIVPSYVGTVHFTSSSAGTLPSDYTFVGGDSGAHTFSVTLTTTGAQSVTATDTVTASITGTANTTVNPPPATHFSVSAPANVTSGVAFNVTVTALDASNATVPSYTGTVHFTSTSAGTLPADYTFVGGDNGAHTFSVTLTTIGAQSVTATDTVTASITGTANTNVSNAPPPPATHFNVTAPANVTTGVAFNVTVTALDASNATVPSYTGTVHFTSSSAGTLPSDYTFVGGDNGVHTFSVTLTTTGAQSVTATDTVTASITGTANTNVSNTPPPPATHFSVSAPANVTTGVAFNVTVTALDASNATVPSYTGTVHFTSTSAGTLPADYTFVGGDNGTHTFSVTLTTTGAQSITATDTVTASITGTANTNVSNTPPPAATHFSVSAPASVTQGSAFNITVTALDASNAVATSYTGTVHFTSSSAGTLPANYTFVAGDNGVHTFSVTLTTIGMQTITATDTLTASITGSTSTTVNCPAMSVTASNNGPACNGSTITLNASTATAGVTYSWSGPGGFTSSQQSPTTTVAGTYTVTITAPGRCTASNATTVVLTPAPVATITTAASVCRGSNNNGASVTTTAGATYAWTISNGTIISGASTSSIVYATAASGNVILHVTVTNGCSTSSSKTVSVGTAPGATVPATIKVCGPQTVTIPVTLTGTAPFTIVWSDGIVQSGIATNTTTRDVMVTTSTTLAIATLYDASCSRNIPANPIVISVDTPASITTQPQNVTIQPGTAANFTVLAAGTNLHYQWFTQSGNGTVKTAGTDSPSFSVDPGTPETQVWVVVSNGCSSIESTHAKIFFVRRRAASH